MSSLTQVFQEHAKASPRTHFLLEDTHAVLTYQQAATVVTQLIVPQLQAFRQPTRVVNHKVVILAPNSSLFVLSVLATWHLGFSVCPLTLYRRAPPVPLHDALVAEPSLAHYTTCIMDIVSLIPSEYLIAVSQTDRVSPFIPPLLRWLQDANYDNANVVCDMHSDPQSVAVTLFTSSAVDWSTLKSVSYTHQVLFQSSERAMSMLGGHAYTEIPKKHLGWLPLSHCFEFCITFCSIVLRSAGSYVFFDRVLTPPKSASSPIASALLEALAYYTNITSMTMIPIVFADISSICTQEQLPLLKRLHSLGVGGAPTSPSLFRWATSAGVRLFDCSGATEMAGTICIRRAWDPEQRLNGLQVIPGLNGLLVKENESDHHGLTYVGRIDDIVVLSSGLKLDAPALEGILNSIPGILRSAIIANKSADTLLALIEMNHSSRITRDELISSVLQINTQLPFDKRIRNDNIIFAKAIPTTTKGRVNRKMLNKLLAEAPPDMDLRRLFDAHDDLPLPTTRLPDSTRVADIRSQVIEIMSRTLDLPSSSLSHETKLVETPLNSLSSTMLAKALQDEYGVPFNAARLYGLKTVDDICHVLVTHAPTPHRNHSSQHPSTPRPGVISITGAACRLTGGIDSLDSFWSALLGPECFVRNCPQKRPDSRWPADHPQENMMYPSYWLDDATFDHVGALARFFQIPPKEVQAMSPNARLVLQLGYEALEDAGIAPKSLRGTNWGVFSSVNDSGWRERRHEENDLKEYSLGLHGSADDAVGARLAYFLDLTGPAVEIKTACSSSAVALHMARLAIQNGDCDGAIVVSATTHFHPSSAIFRSSNGIVSPTGRCIPFASLADGFVTSEGAVAVVLQRADQSRVLPYANIQATGVGQDGASRGFYSPNPEAQKRLLRATLMRASQAPSSISFVEAHGTGTQIGDAIELESLIDVFDENRDKPLFLGSAKAVVGHTEECAGLVGVLKAMLCLSHGIFPPQPIPGTLTDALDSSLNIIAPSYISPLLSTPEAPNLACVSSFGLSGTLASIVLQGVGQPPALFPASTPFPQVFLLSAASCEDLVVLAEKYARFLRDKRHTTQGLQSICRTTQVGRDHFDFRRGFAVNGWSELMSAFHHFTHQPNMPPPMPRPPKIGIWFGLPTSDETANNHPYFRSKVKDVALFKWIRQYHALQNQLALARCLSDLGIDIHMAGGEGVTELLAAVFVGLISPDSIFRLSQDDAHHLVIVEGPRSSVEEHLLLWRPDELDLLGVLATNLFVLKGKPSTLETLFDDASLITRQSAITPTISAPFTISHPCAFPLVSGHLSEVLKEDIVTNTNYWSGVQDRTIDRPAALAEMSKHCDAIVCLGSKGADPDDKLISGPGDSLEHILAALFERGCLIRWDMFADGGPQLSHMPCYTLASAKSK
ncbi:hypothetical protein ONZ45_g4625 [Pleurotus djamor]|nr:hypothetical protein ONZ45_g4625 [Pleurotus djamor]